MRLSEKREQTYIVYDFVYRNGNLELSINQHIKRMERQGWHYIDIKIAIDQNQDDTSWDYLIVFQK